MNAKKLYVLIAVAVIALIAAWYINSSNAPQTGVSARAAPVLPELHGHINDVNVITLTGAGNKILATLKRGADGWTLAEKSGYPADLAKIREFLIKLDQATLTEAKTSNPQLYAELGVDEVKDAKATGVLVTLGGLAKPSAIIIGNYNGAGGGGTFVRREGEAQSWLADGNLTVSKNRTDWEQRTLANIASTRLRAVTLTNPDGKTLKVYKDAQGDANFKVADVPKGREAASEFVANELGSVLSGLNADDVFPANDMAPPDKAWKDEYAAFDGLTVSATGWEQGGKDYAQFSARLDEAAANAQVDAEQAKAKADYEAAVAAANKKVAEEKSTTGVQAKANAQAASEVAKPLAVSDPARDRSDRLAALTKEVANLNKTFSGWTFALPAYKFSDMTKSMDDMLKPLPEKKSEAKKPAAKVHK
ncbi:MAG: DUF4340 domain-containing protein [Rudaea sp.]